jgi:hypothetical protein
MVMTDTPAEISRQRFLYFRFCRMRVFLKKSFGGHDDSGSAKAALKGSVIDKRLLQRVQLAGFRISQPFDGRDVFAIAFDRENLAGIDRFAVHEDGACAAGTLTTGHLSPRQAQSLSQRINQRVRRIDLARSNSHIQLIRLPINDQTN